MSKEGIKCQVGWLHKNHRKGLRDRCSAVPLLYILPMPCSFTAPRIMQYCINRPILTLYTFCKNGIGSFLHACVTTVHFISSKRNKENRTVQKEH